MTKGANSKLNVRLCSCGLFFKGPQARIHQRENPAHAFTVKRTLCLECEVVATEQQIASGQFVKDHGGCRTHLITGRRAVAFLREKLLCAEEELASPPTSAPEAPAPTPVVEVPDAARVPTREEQVELQAALAAIGDASATSSDTSSDGVDLDRSRRLESDLRLSSDDDFEVPAVISNPRDTSTPQAELATARKKEEATRERKGEETPEAGIRTQTQAWAEDDGRQAVSLQHALSSLNDRHELLKKERGRILEELHAEKAKGLFVKKLQKELLLEQDVCVKLRKEKADMARELEKSEERARTSQRVAREAAEAAEADRQKLLAADAEIRRLKAKFAPMESELAVPCVDGVLQPREMSFVTMDDTHLCLHGNDPKRVCHHVYVTSFGAVECKPKKVRVVFGNKRPPPPPEGPPAKQARPM